jgi:hypothetical protein
MKVMERYRAIIARDNKHIAAQNRRDQAATRRAATMTPTSRAAWKANKPR